MKLIALVVALGMLLGWFLADRWEHVQHYLDAIDPGYYP